LQALRKPAGNGSLDTSVFAAFEKTFYISFEGSVFYGHSGPLKRAILSVDCIGLNALADVKTCERSGDRSRVEIGGTDNGVRAWQRFVEKVEAFLLLPEGRI
jgi:hypothetical protein